MKISTGTTDPTNVTDERRTRHEFRAIFPGACAALQPFFDPSTSWAGQSHEHLALRTLKELYPELDAQESFLVVATAKRLFLTANLTLAAKDA